MACFTKTSNRSENSSDQKSAIIAGEQPAAAAPIVSSYNERIRPLLDAVDRLRNLKVMQEGIQLPSIVVVGDQSSGKSSVLESLAGISLPRGQGICTRVPLIMRLQNHSGPQPDLVLEYNGKVEKCNEMTISNAIVIATGEIAGDGKRISNKPLTLIVKKKGVPDLTMIDLPGITRVPVHGQPEDIYEQISEIIMEYITPEESIILNVLSASVDFTTCESIRMSQRVDKTGQRTLAVVTKVDKSPEGLLEKVTGDDVNIGLGYVCVRNRVGEETYEQARTEESRLFENHPLLSKIGKSMVGIPVLAQKLVQIQAAIISKCLPDIVKKINDKLSSNIDNANKLPRKMTSAADALTAFLQIIGSTKESLTKVLLKGEYEEYPDNRAMHCTARLTEMLNDYYEKMRSVHGTTDGKKLFLEEEITILDESKKIQLPNFLPRSSFLTLLQAKVNGVSYPSLEFVELAWTYVGDAVESIMMRIVDNYPQLMSCTRRAVTNAVAKKKQQMKDFVADMIEMEKCSDYTCCSEYVSLYNKFMSYQSEFKKITENSAMPSKLTIDECVVVDLAHLRGKPNDLLLKAYDLNMRLMAYWKVVLRRIVDNIALHLLYGIRKLVKTDLEREIVDEVIGSDGRGVERMLQESPAVADKRKRLMNSIELLKESKEVVANIMDRIAIEADGF